MDDDTIEIRCTLTFADYAQASRTFGRFARVMRVFAVVAVVVNGALFLAEPSLGFVASAAALVAVALLLPELLTYIAYRVTPTLRNRQHLMVDTTGIVVATDAIRTEYAWRQVSEWRELSRVFVLRVGGTRSQSVLLLPTRELPPVDQQRLRDLCEEHVGPSRARRSPTPAAPGGPRTPPPADTPTDRIDLRWTPARADWEEAFRAVSWIHRYPWVVSLAVVAVAGIVFAAVRPGDSGPGGIVPVLGLLAVAVMYLFITKLQVRARFRQLPQLGDDKEGTVDARGVHVRSGVGTDSTLAWEGVARVQETPRTFVLRQGTSSNAPVVLLPKRAVLPPATEADLRELLHRHTGYSPM